MVIRSPPLLSWAEDAGQLQIAAEHVWSPDAYVLHSARASAGYVLAGSDDRVRVFDRDLRPLFELPAAPKGLAYMTTGPGDESNMVWLANRDGSVVGTDLRAPSKNAIAMRVSNRAPLLCCSQSVDEHALAAGSELVGQDVSISIFDVRQQSIVHAYSEAHSDDITQLLFHPDPALAHVLLSASVDGLLNTYDCRIADEDDAIAATCQVGASVVGTGWMPSAAGKAGAWSGVHCATSIETVQTWDVETQDLLSDMGDVRDVCLEPWRTDYIVRLQYLPTRDALCLLAGTQSGSVAIIDVREPRQWTLQRMLAEKTLPPSTSRSLGHTDIVRTAVLDEQHDLALTGGEDGRALLWTTSNRLTT